ncbi:lauroyl acyltransferase [Terrihabitans soli]|uniref:Lauroyl acyltransferase n=1 Tax=Terrihabitans soli TaxID=708113 RepID=A0A6S6QNG8_9HYPH|nr:lauroyl acyltransferase [Terrihabitans soli]BCJ90956.1 lauroyl acyltransferase [Terrihabitans soli]
MLNDPARPDVSRKPPDALLTRMRWASEYAVLRSVERIFRGLGPDRASAFSGWLWQTIAPLTRRQTSALTHLEVAFPDKSAAERVSITRDVWNNLGRTFAEALLIREIGTDPGRIRLMSPDVMKIIADAKGRVVVTSMHYANWELIAPAFQAVGFPMAFIYQRVKNPLSERRLRRLRLTFFEGGVYPKGETAPRRLIGWLKKGHPVLILADQRTGDLKTDFFGYKAPTTPLPAFMARNFDAPLIAARLVRTGGVQFDLYLEQIAVPKTEDSQSDIAEASQTIQSVFERWIAARPGQWMWHHRRWTHRGPPPEWTPQTKTRDPKAAR